MKSVLFAISCAGFLALGACATDGSASSTEPPTANIKGTYWKLVELNGQPVKALEREPHLILKAEGNRVSGFGGCNGFSGGYELNEETLRVRFVGVASTLMACAEGMEVEQGLHEALRTADNYSLNGNNLSLNKARMTPLARFEAVYLK
ncbi:META domain-containing protein [Asticcacaulis tiandongensis]|uniref:META domain-containing protein n=1 Tax=Asticcacaulis tiandongensis TaxID=2565365 RepID=UPI00112E5D4E|nr:META domain-containing protein [Asticcacaulis tiandongensis]